MKIHLKYLLLAVSVCLTLAACGDDDDYHYPSVELSFLTGITDGNGALCRVLADDGSTHTVAEDRTNRITTPDTVIRILANYERIETESAEGSHAKIYSWSNIVSPLPQLPAYFKDDIKTHPVNVVSIFKGYRYLNLIVTVREQTAKHRFHFVEGDSWTDEAGGKHVGFTLYHDTDGLVQDYDKRVYLSMPLEPYLEDTDCLTVHFSVNTYTEQMRTFEFTFAD